MQVNQYLHELVNHDYSHHVGTQNDILESGYADSTDRHITHCYCFALPLSQEAEMSRSSIVMIQVIRAMCPVYRSRGSTVKEKAKWRE